MRRRPAIAALLALLAASNGAAAQSVVTSDRPERVAVTVYRDPDRQPTNAPNLQYLQGYALISETRTVAIPAGETEIRFEGVAGGIEPQSAIVTGFPEGIIERNRDAYLLAPSTLLDRSLGRRVHLRRTSLATGAVREHEAVIRSGAGGAVVLQTADGFEALRCTGLTETLVYDQVPPGLSPRPTLSVRARSSAAATATVTLSYLASGFDWQANYIANLSRDGRHIELFAWLTLASNDETSFIDADTQAVAGQVNREEVPRESREGGTVSLQCWPQARTSDPYVEPAPPQPPMDAFADGEAVVVTARRMSGLAASVPVTMVAQQEELGDLKLYRIPERVTVAANGQKQVALLQRPRVRVRNLYRLRVDAEEEGDHHPNRILVTRNRTAEGLGLPLPAGGFALFAQGPDRPVLIAEGFVADRTVNEDVEIVLTQAVGIAARLEELESDDDGAEEYRLTVTSDHSEPVRFEIEFEVDEASRLQSRRRLPLRAGRPLWAVTIPANGTVTLRYRIENSAD